MDLAPLRAVEMDPKKAEKLKHATELEEAKRKALARWPKDQREAAEKQEYFELHNKDLLDRITRERYASFKGAEDYQNAKHKEYLADIDRLTPESLKAEYGVSVTKDQVAKLRKSLSDTIRDYQIMNNSLVRKLGLHVQFVDSIRGFDIVRDEAYARAKKVEDIVPDNQLAAPQALQAQTGKGIPTKVLSSEKINDSSYMVRVEKPAGMKLKPGEAIRVTLDTANGKQFRTLSLASPPSQNYLEFAVRDSDSPFKSAFRSLKPESQVGVELAHGTLNFKPEEPTVMIAGGIGITPFRSLIQYVKEEKLKTPMWLFYGNRDQIAFGEELNHAAASNPDLKVSHVLSRPDEKWHGERGGIDDAYLQKAVPMLPKNANFYIVGPPQMVTSAKQSLVKMGIPESRISIEIFPGYDEADSSSEAGRAPAKDDPSRFDDRQTVCFCHNVTAGTIRQAVRGGAKTVADIQTGTLASTGCGGCECNVQGILACETLKKAAK